VELSLITDPCKTLKKSTLLGILLIGANYHLCSELINDSE
jgi:hypothetical protein